MRVLQEGTFVYVKGHLIVDGWMIAPDADEELTPQAVNVALAQHIMKMMATPELLAAVHAKEAIQRASKGGDA